MNEKKTSKKNLNNKSFDNKKFFQKKWIFSSLYPANNLNDDLFILES